MLTFFYKKREKPLASMAVDIHSHLLPGIDDGCRTAEESVELLERLSHLGLERFYFTPHIYTEMYPNTPSTIRSSLAKLKGKGYDDLIAGVSAEYMLDEVFYKAMMSKAVDFMSLPGNYILVEMSFLQEHPQIEAILFELMIEGYKPILAHPERYVYYQKGMKRLGRLKELGCSFQINLLSLVGYYGSKEHKLARTLLEEQMVEFIGTDVHHIAHVKAIEKGIYGNSIAHYLNNKNVVNNKMF